MDFLDLADFRGHVYPAHGRHSGSSAMPRAEVIDKIQLKNKKIKFSENVYFFDEKYFSKDFEKSKISKSHFFDFLKNSKFSKKSTFWKN